MPNPAAATQSVAITCSHCGGRNVRRDADAAWDEDDQAWTLVGVYDNATCEDCGGETSLVESPL